MRHDGVQTLNSLLSILEVSKVTQLIQSISDTCHKRLEQSGLKFKEVQEILSFDMLYVGQTHTLNVTLKAGSAAPLTSAKRDWGKLSIQEIKDAFESAYQIAFGRTLGDIAIKVLNLRFSVIGVRPKFDLGVLAPTSRDMPAPLGYQNVFHNGIQHKAVRYARLELPVGSSIEGPAVLEQSDTTLWLEPGFTAVVDKLGNLILTQNAGEED